MSEYEMDPEWSYMGVTCRERQMVTAGLGTEGALRIARAPLSELSPMERRRAVWWRETFLPIREEWDAAVRAEWSRIEANRRHWTAENEPGREQRELLMKRGVEASSSILNKSALVTYRCRSHGCLLGAAMKYQGYLYEIWQTHAEPGWIPADEIQEWALAEGVNGWEKGESDLIPPDNLSAAQVRRIIDDTEGDYEKDGDPIRSDWHPASLSEWLSVEEPARTHRGLFVECVERAPWETLFGTPGRLTNCRHVEFTVKSDSVEADAKRLRGQKKRVVYVDSSGPVRRGK